MIAFLSGRLLYKTPQEVTLLTAGVGYQVFIPLSVFYALPEAGDNVELHIYTHVREDAFSLYGFMDMREREFFLKLREVAGIGPRLAITILSGMPYQELGEAILAQDARRIQSIPGVGRKIAERIIVELKEKISRLSWFAKKEAGAAPSGQPAGGDDLLEDALSALVNLSYPRAMAEKALIETRETLPGVPTLEEFLKATLKRLSGGKLA
jgi:Holliday junction DNA helicase RuvA